MISNEQDTSLQTHWIATPRRSSFSNMRKTSLRFLWYDLQLLQNIDGSVTDRTKRLAVSKERAKRSILVAYPKNSNLYISDSATNSLNC